LSFAAATPTQKASVERSNRLNAGLADPKIKTRLADRAPHRLPEHLPTSASSPPTKPKKWAKVVKSSGAKAD
jgi:hypothetical protein